MNINTTEITAELNATIAKAVKRSVTITETTKLGLLPTDAERVQLDYYNFIIAVFSAFLADTERNKYTDGEFYALCAIRDSVASMAFDDGEILSIEA